MTLTSTDEARIIAHIKPLIGDILDDLQEVSAACLRVKNQGPWCLSNAEYREIDTKIWEIEQILRARIQEESE